MRHLFHLGLFIVALASVGRADAQGRRRGHAEEHEDRRERVVRVQAPPPVVTRPGVGYAYPYRDLDQIADIAWQWRRAVARHDHRGQWAADRRLDTWLSREIRQSVRHPYDHRYAMRLRALNDQLIRLERRHRGGMRGYYPAKARILDELVDLSAWQAQRARGHGRPSLHLGFAVR